MDMKIGLLRIELFPRQERSKKNAGPEAPCNLGIDFPMRWYFKDPKGYRWAFGTAALETEDIKVLYTLPGLSQGPSVVGLLKVEEQQLLQLPLKGPAARTTGP